MTMKPGQQVEVLTNDTTSPWQGGYEFVRCIDDADIRVRQTKPGPGCGHTTTWTHDRVRIAR
jgi:hypothetical protein